MCLFFYFNVTEGVDGSQGHLQLGLLLLSGLFSFAILERLLSSTGASQTETIKGRDCDSQNNNNGDRDIQQKDHHKSIAGNPVQGVSSKRVSNDPVFLWNNCSLNNPRHDSNSCFYSRPSYYLWTNVE